jgi:hypothetical protein
MENPSVQNSIKSSQRSPRRRYRPWSCFAGQSIVARELDHPGNRFKTGNFLWPTSRSPARLSAPNSKIHYASCTVRIRQLGIARVVLITAGCKYSMQSEL